MGHIVALCGLWCLKPSGLCGAVGPTPAPKPPLCAAVSQAMPSPTLPPPALGLLLTWVTQPCCGCTFTFLPCRLSARRQSRLSCTCSCTLAQGFTQRRLSLCWQVVSGGQWKRVQWTFPYLCIQK